MTKKNEVPVVITVQNAPRDREGLQRLQRFVRKRLAIELGMTHDGRAFLDFQDSVDERQAEILAGALQRVDAATTRAWTIRIPPMEVHTIDGHHHGDELISLHAKNHEELVQKLTNLAEVLRGVHNEDRDETAEIFVLRRRKNG